MQNQPASQAQEERENRPFQPSLAGSVPAAVQTGKNWLMELHEHMYADSEQTDNQSVPICMYRAWLEGAWLAGATQDGFIHDEVDLCTFLPSGVPEPGRLSCSVTRL